jgi:uncharacterized protein
MVTSFRLTLHVGGIDNYMMFKNNFVMECKQGILLTNLTSFRMVRLTSDKLDILKSIADKNYTQLSPQETDFFNILESMRQFEDMPYDPEKDASDPLINPTIVLSYDCNLQCTYCYQNDIKKITGHMTEKHIDNIDLFYDVLCSHYQREKKYGSITITGGEPCLPQNRSVIKYILDKLKSEKVNILTNGVNLLDFVDDFNGYNVELHISLDGTKETHERHRKTKASQSTYEKTVNAIKVALDRGFNITISSLFFIDAIEEYPAFFDLLESLGWPNRENLSVKFQREAYHGADEINSEYNHKIIDAFVNLKSMDKRSEYIVTGGLVPGLSRFMYEFKSYINGNFIQNAYRCDILRQASYVFSPTGYVFLCYSSPEVCKIGSYYPDVCIDENQIYRLSERNTLKMAKCTGCIYKTICRGGCVVSALESGFDISEPFCGVFSDESILNRFGELLF